MGSAADDEEDEETLGRAGCGMRRGGVSVESFGAGKLFENGWFFLAPIPADWVSDSDEKNSDNFSWETDEDDKESPADPPGEASEAGPSQPSLYSHFIGMGFSGDMVEKAIKENGEGNVETILETLLTYSQDHMLGSMEMHISKIAPSLAALLGIGDLVAMGGALGEGIDSQSLRNEACRWGWNSARLPCETRGTSAKGGDCPAREDLLNAAPKPQNQDSAIGNSPSDREDAPAECPVTSDEDSFDSDMWDSDDPNDQDFIEGPQEKDKKLLTLVDMGFSPEEADAAIDRCGITSLLVDDSIA
ncbi:hypothetical protein M5K25_005365 [Dendrobium thyrsiflorum]|uniref:UBA domain-containing protein n=1 Tax=Dendrobium thyrsiflorum TaxID=117978 RepID=A0ABD0VID3_DENTH